MAKIKNKPNLNLRTIVCQIHLEQREPYQNLTNLEDYEQAFVVFRFKGAVVGQVWLPVKDGRINSTRFQNSLTMTAWPVWQRLVTPESSLKQQLPTASVVVCTRDRTDDLRNCLPGLVTLAKQGYEVMVIDNCPSDDSTARLVAQYSEIQYVYEPRPGLNVARNRGLQLAKGEIVAFTDDDAQIEADWLRGLLHNFDDPVVAIVTGITLPLELETQAQHWFEWTNSFSRGFVRKEFDTNTIGPLAAGAVGAGVNMAIRRSAVLERIGLFDEALDGGTTTRSGGDQEFFYRTMSRGYRIVYDPMAVAWHRHRRDWPALRQTIHAYGVGLLAWWTRTLIVEKDLSVLMVASSWFWQYHTRNLIKALLGRSKRIPLDLAWAEFRGALAGPASYLKARKLAVQQQSVALKAKTASLNPDVITLYQPEQTPEVQ